MNDPVFICPFNAYHKIFDHRKHMFHIARCKDRRGKSMFHCKYKHAHIYTSLELLLQHEQTCDCKTEERQDALMIDQERHPSATYCKFNFEHCFRSLADRDSHE